MRDHLTIQQPPIDADAAPDGPSGSPSDGQWTPAQIKVLKTAVIIMGVILIVGMAVVVGRIMYLAQQQHIGGQGAPAPRPAMAAALQPNATLALPAGAKVRHLSLSGTHLAVHFEAASGGAIAIIDLASGRVVSSISLTRQLPSK